MAAIFNGIEEKKVVKSWAKRCFLKVAKVSLVLTVIMSLGALVEYKYRVIGGIHQLAAKKGR